MEPFGEITYNPSETETENDKGKLKQPMRRERQIQTRRQITETLQAHLNHDGALKRQIAVLHSSAALPTAAEAVATNAAAPALIALVNAAALWAQVSTNSDLDRAKDVRRDKLRVVREFFAFLDKEIAQTTPLDVQAWQLALEKRLKARTVYLYSAHLSSFFEWLRRQPEFQRFFPYNPVRAAFPKAPNPYESDGTRSLTDESFTRLWNVIELAAQNNRDVIALRDYAIFRFFVATGARRSEILNLRGRDVELSAKTGGLVYYPRVKGGTRLGKAVSDRDVRRALVEYLTATARRFVLETDQPLWLAHDRAAQKRAGAGGNGESATIAANASGNQLIPAQTGADAPPRLSSHAFARRMKLYAKTAGINGFHLHQLRHTFARLVSEDTGSISQTQEALGHKNQKTTGAYVARIEIKADQHSERIAQRLRRRND